MTATPLMKNVFQLAYVTSDLDAAAAVFRDSYGAGEFLFMRDLPGATTDIALAYAGDMMIELLQPVGGVADFYSTWIKGMNGLALRHHHYGMLVDTKAELAEIKSAYSNRKVGFPLEGEMPGALDYLYADTTAELGHYLEYIRLDEGGRQMFAGVPGSPFGR